MTRICCRIKTGATVGCSHCESEVGECAVHLRVCGDRLRVGWLQRSSWTSSCWPAVASKVHSSCPPTHFARLPASQGWLICLVGISRVICGASEDLIRRYWQPRNLAHARIHDPGTHALRLRTGDHADRLRLREKVSSCPSLSFQGILALPFSPQMPKIWALRAL